MYKPMKKVVQSDIIWRGSITDLATDVAYLLTIEQADELIKELRRFQNNTHLNDKFQGKGFEEVK